MLVVLMEYKGEVIYLRPFEDHQEAIEHFSDLYFHRLGDVCLTLSGDKVIPLRSKEEQLKYIR